MSGVSDQLLDQLDAYLDGSLPAGERAAFERRLGSDAALRREFEMARRIEGSLRGVFAPPAVVRAPVEHRQERAVIGRIGFSRTARWVALAACLTLVAAAGLLYQARYGGQSPRPTTVAEALYQNLIQTGYKPEWVCKDDAEFAKAVADRLGQPLLVEPEPALTLVGWAYTDGEKPYSLTVVSKETMVLLTKVNGKRVVGLVDRVGAGSQPRVSASSGLSLFERRVGSLILYEITPLSESHLLGRFYDPSRPRSESSQEASPVKRCPSPAP